MFPNVKTTLNRDLRLKTFTKQRILAPKLMSHLFTHSAVREREQLSSEIVSLSSAAELRPGSSGHATLASSLLSLSLSLQLTMTAWSVVISSRDDGIILCSHHPLATRWELFCPIGYQLAQSGFCLYLIQLQGFSQNCKPPQTLSQHYITKQAHDIIDDIF